LPKLTVIVEKDDAGKLWNFMFNQEDLACKLTAFRTNPIQIHTYAKPELQSKTPLATLTQRQNVVAGVLNAGENRRLQTKVKIT
jgi:hypothetical protein